MIVDFPLNKKITYQIKNVLNKHFPNNNKKKRKKKRRNLNKTVPFTTRRLD